MNNLNTGQGQGWPPPEPPPLSGSFVAAMVALAIVVPLLGPAVAVAVGAMSLPRRGAKTILWTGGIVLVASVLAAFVVPVMFLTASNFQMVQEATKSAMVKQGIWQIKHVLDSHATENGGVFPESLASAGEFPEFQYYGEMVHNPWTKEFMRHVDFSDGPSKGDFTYIPVRSDGKVTGYYLLGYGHAGAYNEKDVDGDGQPDQVVIVFSSGTYDQPTGEMHSRYTSGKPLPPLEEVLQGRPAETE